MANHTPLVRVACGENELRIRPALDHVGNEHTRWKPDHRAGTVQLGPQRCRHAALLQRIRPGARASLGARHVLRVDDGRMPQELQRLDERLCAGARKADCHHLGRHFV